MIRWLKKYWKRLALQRARVARDSRGYNYKKLDTFYLMKDPWNMASTMEQYRFVETNRFILQKFGHVKSLLEIGCGEGHQTLYFHDVCEQLAGLDVSSRAVSRAQKRCPESKFIVGDIFSREVEELAPFDLVVACEVLYYISDIHAALNRMEQLSNNRLVTYYSRAMQKMDPKLIHLSGAVTETFKFKGTEWRAVCWRQTER